ncbi:hypothetical protein PFLUV_G00054350 [Perca fluviatilis]|uniref:Uncharacterized protein n=1 Tax=Perca fluviatilis TaxID=8168 RepID=A0A6A5FIG8_PERFL|nr:uncharacterized protein si:dkey-261h17.1 [Perca fluviatilis]XP_039657631.1 uncharacterized protein si:dkey-261h17.1 [Perca fluviatilis]XP_039657632.1 uncharacterized protein si:dkey-261h17.1 [Perca fluviatilis]XP_039657633.1 uncharacterized protein si:dkey-261h17.1 [Perca fluviatilis]KAF1390074.1 hypothetical protein PFLUV_G00054350 [Perca fluviatilis]
MAASMWRMNGLWRRMAGLLVLCALLLSNEVMCQDDAATDPTDAPDATAVTATAAPDAAGPDATTPDTTAPASHAADPDAATAAPDVGASTTGESANPAASVDDPIQATIVNIVLGDLETTAVVTDVPHTVVPDVMCVGKEDVPESNAVKVELATNDCEASKLILMANPAGWCSKEKCNLKLFQESNTLLVASDDAPLASLARTLESEHLKDKLGVTKTETPSSSGSSVFVGILVTGLLAALAIVVGYLKCPRRSDAKGVRLAEEAYPADQENQGNTLVSVAPLNPPPETPEKPSVNGESPEEAKTQPPPPTNGHSTTKTADTEL